MDHENFNRLVEIMGCLDLLHKYAIDEKLSDDSESDSSDVSRRPYVTARGSIKSPKAKKPSSDSDDFTPSRRSADFIPKLAYKSRKRASTSSSDDDEKKQPNPTHLTHLAHPTHLTHPFTSPPNRQHITYEEGKRSPLSPPHSPPSPSHSASPPCTSTAQSGTLLSLTPRTHNSHRSSVENLHTPAVYLRRAETLPAAPDGHAGTDSSQMGLNKNSAARHSLTSITSNIDLLKPIRTKKERRPLLSHLTEWSGMTQSEGMVDGRRVSGVSQVSQVSQVRGVSQVSQVSGESQSRRSSHSTEFSESSVSTKFSDNTISDDPKTTRSGPTRVAR
eukprot:GHVN01005950.1.p1 GENE.GHVN01005950.1~~GHVN01005950.1.p1  ORF type:complete len:332 (-),score=109.11 GHVN01005950.1:11-1006(-)